MDKKMQMWRLKNREYDFHEWYNNNFRIDYSMSTGGMNG
jgi:hypothetical protein